MDIANNNATKKEVSKNKPGSNRLGVASIIVGAVLIFLVGFAAGTRVSFHKARFSNDFGKNYERNFMGPVPPGPMGMFHDFSGHGMRNPHGIAGSIISIAENNIVIKDRDDKENTISVTDKTVIKNQAETIKIENLKTDDKIVVLGKPDDNGTVQADLIRVLPENPEDIE